MYSGYGYSDKLRHLQKEHYDQLKELNQEQKIRIHNKTKKFSIENAKRRRALELKKKIEAQKEAKRRQEALDERRRRQNEATIKYQRHNRGTSAHERTRTPGLEEALNAIQITTVPSYRTKYTTTQQSPTNTVHIYSPWRPTATPTTTYNSQAYRAQHEQLQSSSTQNLNQSRSLFEQQLQEQQRQLAYQQQQSLHDFNQAILNESRLENHEDEVHDSQCSIDSLDGTTAREEKRETQQSNNHENSSTTLVTSATSHSQGQYLNTSEGLTAQNNHEKLFVTKSGTTGGESGGPGQRSDLAQTGQRSEVRQASDLYIEETSEADIVEDKLDRAPYTSEATMTTTSHTTSSSPRFSGSKYGNTWSPTTGASMYANTHILGSRQPRPFSARTAATGVTVAPAAYNWNEYSPARTNGATTTVGSHHTNLTEPSGNSSHITNHTDPQGSNNQYTYYAPVNGHSGVTSAPHNNSTKSQSTHENYKSATEPTKQTKFNEQNKGLHFIDETGEDETTPDDTPLAKPQVTQPKGILKKTPSSPYTSRFTRSAYIHQNTSLEGLRLRDSIDIAKSKSVDGPEDSGKKKSVRWTDWEKHSKLTQQLGTPRGAEDSIRKRRPFSATTMSLSSVPPSVKAPRSASAGSLRKMSATKQRPGLKPQPVVANRKIVNPHNHRNTAAVVVEHDSSRTYSDVSPAANPGHSTTAMQNGDEHTRTYIYHAPALDKTPTDDEINWLWDKVRSCLHKENEVTSKDGIIRRPTDIHAQAQTRPTATVQKQTIDGRQFVGNLRPTAVSSAGNTDNGNFARDRGVVRKVHRPNGTQTGNSYMRLLQLRKQHAQRVGHLQRHTTDGQQQAEYQTIQAYSPADSVSDSLQLFQTAEKLSQQTDMTETDITAALLRQQQVAAIHAKKAPSSLSLEEQRILQSLDRLNERLRIVTDGNLKGTSLSTKPAQYTMRVQSATNNTTSGTSTAPTPAPRRQGINKNIRRVSYRH
ncbi:uncharacterized protein LOC144454001 isoform X2 [Glandiceps talaboti]